MKKLLGIALFLLTLVSGAGTYRAVAGQAGVGTQPATRPVSSDRVAEALALLDADEQAKQPTTRPMSALDDMRARVRGPATQPSKRRAIDDIMNGATGSMQAQESGGPVLLSPEQLFKKVSPAVVKIIIKNDDDRPIGSGSGFFVSGDRGMGVLVTNYHVIRSAVSAVIQLNDDSEAPAVSVLAEDEATDLALLAVACKPDRILVMQSAMWDEVDVLTNGVPGPEIGKKVFCVSSPKGLRNTLSEGLVSGYRRGRTKAVWMQISAPISHGSSGGAVLTADGTVIGVATSCVVDGQNLNFAVPMSEVKRLLARARTPRPMWKGTSIRLEEAEAESAVFRDLLGPTDDPENLDANQIDASLQELHRLRAEIEADFPKYVEKLAKGGSQDGLLYKALFQAKSKDFRGAIGTLKTAAKAKPGPHEYLVHHEMGSILLDLAKADAAAAKPKESSKNMNMAVSSLRRSIEENPSFSPAFRLLALSCMQTNNYADAINAANRLVELAPRSAESYRIRGAVYGRFRRDKEEMHELEVAVELDPLNFRVCYSLATTSLHLQLPANAVQAFKQAAEASRGNYERYLALHGLGTVYLGQGDYQQAIDAYEEALESCQDSSKARDLRRTIMMCREHLER